MTDFRKLEEGMFASPQIEPADIAHAKELGVTLVINNRPDGEEPFQTTGAEIEAAARAAGMDYLAIPVTQAGMGHAQVEAMAEALANAGGPVLAYCRSGTRSTFLWSLAQASRGRNVDEIMGAAAKGGYDVAPIRQMMEMLSTSAG
ncbi:MAG: TIGR01244 family sulfur transferase [Novosphingobium sp.]|nr:TIGR01244 family sulfur transferase [Novosphingobium sp.]